MTDNHRVPAKANRVLNLILLSFLLIFIRVWHLAVVQHDELLEQSRKPQTRALLEKTERATIRDRFNIPLAVNQIEYHAAIRYAEIKQIPQSIWKKEGGKKVKIAARARYIEELSQILAQTLDLDAQRIEDLIHSKASLFPHLPYFIQKGISETAYYRLKMLEKKWQGICATQGYKRVYPQGKTGSDIIGYLGAISEQKHFLIAKEIKELATYLEQREAGETPLIPKGFHTPIEVRERLKELQQKAYSINDVVGKAGIEAACEETLRGFYTKRFYEVDRLGKILRELPGSHKPVNGQRVLLSLSAELQAFAESLLASKENGLDPTRPWIKGGAIVAMLPDTGEVVALASYPRFDPNDFTEKRPSLIQWIENESYIGEIWDGKRNLEKEGFSPHNQTFTHLELPLTWENFLAIILNQNSPVFKKLHAIRTIEQAVNFQKDQEGFQEQDDALALDLCSLAANSEDFSEELLTKIGTHSLSSHRSNCQKSARAEAQILPILRKLFHEIDFKVWRNQSFTEFLKKMRQQEALAKQPARPYIDYLDKKERELFQTFWNTHRLTFLSAYFMPTSSQLSPYLEAIAGLKNKEEIPLIRSLPPDLALEYLETLRTFSQLNFPLRHNYQRLRNANHPQTGKELAAAFYPISGYGYGRSFAYRQSTPAGSPFKLIVAYQALMEKYLETKQISQLNPLTLIDDFKGSILGYHLNKEAITRIYKGGRLPRSSHPHIGKIDLMGAIEQSSNIYFSLLASEVIKDPRNLIQCASLFGFGEKTGIELPGEIMGNLPHDIAHNKTGLYSFAIGQHSLVVTPLQTAVMLSTIANEGALLKPRIIQMIAGQEPSETIDQLFSCQEYAFKGELALVGVHFPLFTQASSHFQRAAIIPSSKEVKNQIAFPQEIHTHLLEGMHKVVTGPRGTARPAAIRKLFDDTASFEEYLAIHKDLVGKTGTAEILYKQTLDSFTPAKIENHVWFGGISFDKPFDAPEGANPELVVVVYLQFGGGGKEAAPLAAQIVKKWREIKQKHQL